MAERPGTMFYFDIIPVLDELTDEQVGQIFRGALKYAKDGDEPQLDSQILRIVWAQLKQSLDRDSEHYAEVCAKNSYRIYCRWEKEKGREPLPYDEWYTSVYQRIPDDTDYTNYNSTTTQLQPNYNSTTTTTPTRGTEGGAGGNPPVGLHAVAGGLCAPMEGGYTPPDSSEWNRLKNEKVAKLREASME